MRVERVGAQRQWSSWRQASSSPPCADTQCRVISSHIGEIVRRNSPRSPFPSNIYNINRCIVRVRWSLKGKTAHSSAEHTRGFRSLDLRCEWRSPFFFAYDPLPFPEARGDTTPLCVWITAQLMELHEHSVNALCIENKYEYKH